MKAWGSQWLRKQEPGQQGDLLPQEELGMESQRGSGQNSTGIRKVQGDLPPQEGLGIESQLGSGQNSTRRPASTKGLGIESTRKWS